MADVLYQKRYAVRIARTLAVSADALNCLLLLVCTNRSSITGCFVWCLWCCCTKRPGAKFRPANIIPASQNFPSRYFTAWSSWLVLYFPVLFLINGRSMLHFVAEKVAVYSLNFMSVC